MARSLSRRASQWRKDTLMPNAEGKEPSGNRPSHGSKFPLPR
jgi:hypothetical protein